MAFTVNQTLNRIWKKNDLKTSGRELGLNISHCKFIFSCQAFNLSLCDQSAVSNNFNRLAANCGEVPTFKTSHGRTLTEVNHSQEALKLWKSYRISFLHIIQFDWEGYSHSWVGLKLNLCLWIFLVIWGEREGFWGSPGTFCWQSSRWRSWASWGERFGHYCRRSEYPWVTLNQWKHNFHLVSYLFSRVQSLTM